MNRREFLQHSTSAVVGSSVLLNACRNGGESIVEDKNSKEEGAMTYRTNPNTGDKVSLLGFGMMRLPVEEGGTARENPDAPIDQQAVNDMVDEAIKRGVNFFDSSPVYCQGLSEQATGIALSRYPRKSYFLSTKLSNFSPDTWSFAESKAMFERSLQNFQTDYLDYYMLHGLGLGGEERFRARYIENGVLDWLVEQKKAGRIRHLGFSFHGDLDYFKQILALHDSGKYHWDFALIQLNYVDWLHAKENNPRNSNAADLYAELEKRNIPVLVMEPLLGGRLAHQPEPIARRLKELDIKASMASWAFRFAGTPKGILSVLSGMTYAEHLRDNCTTFSPLKPLNEHEHETLMQLAAEIVEMKAIPCTACNYCMPCPYGLNIPAIFGYYNNYLTEDLSSAKWLKGYNKKIEKMRQADHCIGCNRCIKHCPQYIDIPKEMIRVDRLVEQLKKSII